MSAIVLIVDFSKTPVCLLPKCINIIRVIQNLSYQTRIVIGIDFSIL